eukprot:TRINITY_DN3189_c0_g1_i4.p1 TRINITY_DN3189_c0_g1~~TRINITY_DN3189_c0_g1_i4.p1  ORF type:complete len:469 (-),score=81.07 TRINITY_DN3189_c0_g1_i4:34-1440(-)
MALSVTLVSLCVLLFCGAALCEEITKLPGLSVQPSFKQYSGYKVVDESHGRALFYWFTESQRDPKNDPTVLWLTGGPGCSSVMAFLSEQGPFRPNMDGTTLSYNPYSWNRIANVIWLESPAGVGFSYSNTSSDYNTGDLRTKEDTYNFLIKFFEEFPQLRKNPFWVTGESYGGHYVPEITQLIYQNNQKAPSSQTINISGFMVGNAWTYMPIDNLGAINTWWQRYLVPQAQSESIIKACNLSDVGPLLAAKHPQWQLTDTCSNVINDVMNVFNDIDIYDIYVDVCHASVDFKMIDKLKEHLLLHSHLLPKEAKSTIKTRDAFDPCIDSHLTNYLNIPAVQTAIHARPTKWSECSDVVNYNYEDIASSVIPIYWDLLNNTKLNILVYSGDVDGIVPTAGSVIWTQGLGRTVKEAWRPWMDERGQVGGFVEVYDRFTFATVRGAGHMVPYYHPQRGWVLFSSYLEHQRFQ